ncbi:hypothetical protein PSPO01_11680 [Paraphaeosphaeria sporulosa]
MLTSEASFQDGGSFLSGTRVLSFPTIAHQTQDRQSYPAFPRAGLPSGGTCLRAPSTSWAPSGANNKRIGSISQSGPGLPPTGYLRKVGAAKRQPKKIPQHYESGESSFRSPSGLVTILGDVECVWVRAEYERRWYIPTARQHAFHGSKSSQEAVWNTNGVSKDVRYSAFRIHARSATRRSIPRTTTLALSIPPSNARDDEASSTRSLCRPPHWTPTGKLRYAHSLLLMRMRMWMRYFAGKWAK